MLKESLALVGGFTLRRRREPLASADFDTIHRMPPEDWRRLVVRTQRVDRNFLNRVGARLAEVEETETVLAFLERSSQALTEGEIRRIANALGDGLRRRSAARLMRVAEACRRGGEARAPRISPVYANVILFHEMRHLHNVRAARSALEAVEALRAPRFDGARSPALEADILLYEARLRHRLDDIAGALRALRRLRVENPRAAAAFDLEATLLYPTDPEAAAQALETRFEAFGHGSKESNTLYAELLARAGRRAEAERFLTARLARSQRPEEYLVGMANLHRESDPDFAKLWLAKYWESFGLEMGFGEGPITMETVAIGRLPPAGAALRRDPRDRAREKGRDEREDEPDSSEEEDAPATASVTRSPADALAEADARVTVVMTAWNAEAHIAHAIESVLAQTWTNLELIVVDDVSQDGTCAVVEAIAARDPRLRLTRRKENAGTYVAKNAAIAEATGDFVALCDSDDWWHPRHLERHLAAMRGRPEIRLTTSAWVRMDETGRIALKHNGGYLHFNPASTLFRGEVFREIGYFDSVRIGADSEFVWRFRHYYGRAAEIELRQPLAIGRLHGASLTQSGVGAYNENNVSPARLDYWESWCAWHRAQALEGGDLRLGPTPPAPGERPFHAPEEILP